MQNHLELISQLQHLVCSQQESITGIPGALSRVQASSPAARTPRLPMPHLNQISETRTVDRNCSVSRHLTNNQFPYTKYGAGTATNISSAEDEFTFPSTMNPVASTSTGSFVYGMKLVQEVSKYTRTEWRYKRT